MYLVYTEGGVPALFQTAAFSRAHSQLPPPLDSTRSISLSRAEAPGGRGTFHHDVSVWPVGMSMNKGTLHCPRVDPLTHDSIPPNCTLLHAFSIYSTPDPEEALAIRKKHPRATLGSGGRGKIINKNAVHAGHNEGWRSVVREQGESEKHHWGGVGVGGTLCTAGNPVHRRGALSWKAGQREGSAGGGNRTRKVMETGRKPGDGN